MRNVIGLAAAAAIALSLAAVGAEAMPLATIGAQADAPAITLVSGGCGPFGHRTPWGACRPNGGFYGHPRFYGGPGYFHRCFFRPTPFGPRRICR